MRPVTSILAAALGLTMLLLSALAAAAQDRPDWSGEWETFWRGGLATLDLRQEGDQVSGTYQPGDGRIEGTVEGNVLRGTWRGDAAEGEFVFALAEDGGSFTGRFGNGEYWNGVRGTAGQAIPGQPVQRSTPAEVLRSILIRGNAAVFEGNAAALREAERLFFYPEGRTSDRETGTRGERRQVLWDVLDLSTLRLSQVPRGPTEEGDDTATFEIGPLGGDATFTLTFRRTIFGWSLEVPPIDVLEDARDRFLESLGVASVAEFNRVNDSSPRVAMFTFLGATGNWEDGGREAALSVMDLSEIPERLRTIEGELLADYLWGVINRIGFIVRQEIPNLKGQAEPYVFYAHPVGNVVIDARVDPETEEPVWRFTAETLETIPQVYRAMQDLPVAEGLEGLEPLSDFFVIREWIRRLDPRLLERPLYLENWQWIGLALVVAAAALAGYLARLVVPWLVGMVSRVRADENPSPASLARPAGAFVFLLTLLLSYSRLGLAQGGSVFTGRFLALAVVIAGAMLVFRLVGVVGGAFRRRASQSNSYMDEIVTSLALGLVKLLVIIAAIIFAADVVGLPYEGVLTGLGVGGVALAFAARDTVSNFLGGAILLADRPFKRGDLIDMSGEFALIEEVGLRSTKLRTLDDALLVVPNSHLSDRMISNWGKRRRRRVKMTIGLTYDTPAEKLDRFCKELEKVYKAQTWTDDSEVYIGVTGFAASSIDIDLIGFFLVTAYDRQVEAQHALVLDIVRLAERVGVSFAFPTRTVHLAPPESGGLAELAEPQQSHAAQ